MGEVTMALAGSFLWWGLIRNHDAFFKWVMDQPGVAEALLEFVLPAELRRLWDGSALVAQAGSLITRELKERRTDRSYLCPASSGTTPPLLVIFEHKSFPDRAIGWQLAQYIYEHISAWIASRRHLPPRQRRQLPLAAAVVVYHGKWRWRVPLSLSGPPVDGALAAYLSTIRYLLVDVLRTPVECLPPVPRLRMAFMIWQFDRKSPGTLKDRLVELARAALALGIDDLTAMVYYLWGETDQRGVALLSEVLDQVIPERRGQIMLTAGGQLVAEGKAIGRAEGLAKGLVDGLAKGLVEGEARVVLRQLSRRFGELQGDVVERVRTADLEQLDTWSERLLDARSLNDVFGSGRPH